MWHIPRNSRPNDRQEIPCHSSRSRDPILAKTKRSFIYIQFIKEWTDIFLDKAYFTHYHCPVS